MRTAVLRRLRRELWILPTELELILPTFRCRATAADRTVESQLCPVHRAVTATDAHVTADPTEVDEAWRVPWAECVAQVDGGDPLSSWAAQQVEQLAVLGPAPLDGLDLVALMIDGVGFGEHLCLVALGIGIDAHVAAETVGTVRHDEPVIAA